MSVLSTTGIVFSTSLPSTTTEAQKSAVSSAPLLTSIIPSKTSPFQSDIASEPSSQTTASVPADTVSTPGTSFVPAPNASLSRSTQIGLGVGISLGGLFLIALGAFLTYYAIRIRGRNTPDNPYGIDGNPDSQIVREVAYRRQSPFQELSGVQREKSRKELDGTHWKRELPALPEHGLRRSEMSGL